MNLFVKKSTKIKSLFFTLFLLSLMGYAQVKHNKEDSISELDYKSLGKYINLNMQNEELSNIYAKAYLNKAKKELDTLRIIKALHWYHLINIKTCGFDYVDTIINLSKGKGYQNYPLIAYSYKGHVLYKKRNFIASLDNYLEVQKLNTLNDDRISLKVDFKIALIKNRLGQHAEAIRIFKKSYTHYTLQHNYVNTQIALFGIGDSFRLMKEMDSSMYYNSLGMQKATLIDDEENISYFSLNMGATLSDKRKLDRSNKLLLLSLPKIKEFKDKPNIAMCHFFLGRNYYNLNKTALALFHLKKMDSIFLEINDLHPELRQGYEILIKHYADKKELKNQLLYVNRVLKLDSILLKNYKYLSHKISKEYDHPKILNEKEKLIEQIKIKKNNYGNLLVLITTSTIILLIFIFRMKLQHKKDKEKVARLLNSIEKQQINPSKNIINKNDYNSDENIGINDEVIKEILSKLELFERNLEFINFDLSAVSLAKELETNSTYLSKIINHYKKQTFSTYVNSLRIDYAIERLKNDIQFRNFTIKAIGNESGFKSTESFTSAFHKKTGLRIKYFLKELNKS
ncbi:helix-turn-helix domain-containing protein [Lacinutrix neustonica]|uniref:Helix-turn-helix domain-containing protein n=1 Tax=Lacinutrix neustonica TaxID=2980107 RepID=A0A9E8SEM9_9FLAO|nr:helix-turn-helix domain-containing protein [Lacinutrix neustonica]WAC03723.1 helix-turn-helix domain-containing protein [Lacinutrix neustonica]